MADKPSRGVVLYGYGFAHLMKPTHTYLHQLASIGSCGFLALDDNSSLNQYGGNANIIRELAQLLDASEAVDSDSGQKGSDSEAPKQVLTMKERFMGMKAAMVTSNSDVKQFGEKLGFSVTEFDRLTNGKSAKDVADELLKLLGFQDGKTLDKDHFDLVLMHIGAHANEDVPIDLDYADNLIGQILQISTPGSEVGSRLHLSLIMSYGADSKDDPNLSLESLADENTPELRCLLPRQSYTLKGVDLRNDIRHHCPMLVAQWQDAVTRKDTVQEFSFTEFKRKSGNLAIAADRFLYEVAFKLWKAPKYGA